jgi:hypothetical protein
MLQMENFQNRACQCRPCTDYISVASAENSDYIKTAVPRTDENTPAAAILSNTIFYYQTPAVLVSE